MRWFQQAGVLALTGAICLTAGYFLHDFLEDIRCDIASSMPAAPQRMTRKPDISKDSGPPAWMPASGHTQWHVSIAADASKGKLTLEDLGSGSDSQIDIWAMHVSPIMAVSTVTLHSGHRHDIDLPSGRYRIRIRRWERPPPEPEKALTDARIAAQPDHVREIEQIRIQTNRQSSLLLYAGQGLYFLPPTPPWHRQATPADPDRSTAIDEQIADPTGSQEEPDQ